MKKGVWVLSMALLLGAVKAQESIVYRGFAELRQPQVLPQSAWAWQPNQALFNSLVPGTLRLLGIVEQSRQISQPAEINPMAAYVGKAVQFYWEGQWRSATLVSLEPLLFLYEGRYLPSLPGLVAYPNADGFKPEAGPKVTFRYQGAGPATLVYLTRGVSWNLRYTLELSEQSELVGWATLTNSLGNAISLGKTELVAGAVPLLEAQMNVPAAQLRSGQAMMNDGNAEYGGAEFVGEASGTFRYRLPGEISLEPGLTELPFVRSPVKPVYAWRYQGSFNAQRSLGFTRGFRFEASENLAAGAVSIRDGGVFVGQSAMTDTAKGNSVVLWLGPDPDGRATRQVEQLPNNRFRVTTEVRNNKTYPVEVEFMEFMPQPFELEGQGLERLPEGYRLRFTLAPGASRNFVYTVAFTQQR